MARIPDRRPRPTGAAALASMAARQDHSELLSQLENQRPRESDGQHRVGEKRRRVAKHREV